MFLFTVIHLALVLLSVQDTIPFPFHLDAPARTYRLPPELMEISALTDVDEHTIACLHDEAAQLYFVDLRNGRVVRRLQFAGPGDMEGLTRVGDAYYALRSDGLVYRLILEGSGVQVTDTFRLVVPNTNIEGLGWDERMGRVLVSPKDVPKGTPDQRDERRIYCYDPVAARMCDQPVLTLSVRRVLAEARQQGMAVPLKNTGNGRSLPALKLRFSSVAVDPFTDRYYLLSAVDRILLVVDRAGKLVSLQMLDPKLFAKPEGITFLPSGDMLISNEGKGMPPNIHRFDRLN
jgi:uncharacterized protein YjiK